MQKYWQWISLPHSYFSSSVVSDSLRPHESQHARPPCPSPAPGVHPNSCASSRWCHPTISSSVVPFSSCPQSLPASGSFPMSQLFTWGGQSIHTHTHTQLQEKTRCESQISFYFLPSPQHLLSTPRLGALPRPNLISNSHPSTWLSLWDCILMRQQPSHSIWFCQSTACLVSTPSSIRFSYFLFFEINQILVCWRYWINMVWGSTAWPYSKWKHPSALSGRSEGYFSSASFRFPCALTTQPVSLQIHVTFTKSFPIPTLQPRELETSLWDTPIHSPIHLLSAYHIHGIGNPKFIKIWTCAGVQY